MRLVWKSGPPTNGFTPVQATDADIVVVYGCRANTPDAITQVQPLFVRLMKDPRSRDAEPPEPPAGGWEPKDDEDLMEGGQP